MFSAAGFAKTWEYIDLFKQGLVCTISLSFLTVMFGFILALVLAIMRLSNFCPFRALGLTKDGRLREPGLLTVLAKFNPLDFIATAYVEILRSTPVMVQIFVIYYVVLGNVDLPSFKLFGMIRFDRFFPGVVALSMNSGAYLCEIIRAGIQSIDGGQTEAARSLGLNPTQTMRHIILPQAFKAVLPSLANEFIVLLKETSVASFVSVADLTYAGNIIGGNSYDYLFPLLMTAMIYLAMVMFFSYLVSKLERRLRNSER